MTVTEQTFNPPIFPNLEVSLTLVGWNYSNLGAYLGLSNDGISKRMRGILEFKLDELVKVAALFNKPIEWLFYKNDCAKVNKDRDDNE